MNKNIKNIAALNFKSNADLEVQYVFNDGHCYFHRSAAQRYAKDSGLRFEEVKRDDEGLKASDDETAAAKLLEKLEAECQTKMDEVLNETDQEKKIELEIELEELENQIEALKG